MRVQELDKSVVRLPGRDLYTASSDASIYSAWVRGCVVGATFGLAVSAMIAVINTFLLAEYRSEAYRTLSGELVAVAAVVEGGVIGYCQWRILRLVFPTMSSRMWTGATIVAAAVGCLIAWLPTSFATTAAAASRFGDVSIGLFGALRLSILTGAMIGIVWGIAQYAVLHRHAHHAGVWILSSTAAWSVAFTAMYFAAFWPDRTINPLMHIALGAGAGVALGLALGVLNGRALIRLRSRLLAAIA